MTSTNTAARVALALAITCGTLAMSGTAGASPDLPGAPTGVTATGGPGRATVNFTPPASDGGAAITSYTVTAAPGGTTATGTQSPITVTGLNGGAIYTFTVTATNAVGPGPASDPSNSVTIVPASPTL